MNQLNRQHRGLHYRRTKYAPGFGICSCSSCSDRYSAAERLHQRIGAVLPKAGEPNPDCIYVNHERVFAEEWEKENERNPGFNYGRGILQDLMVTQRQAKPGQPWARDSFSLHGLRVAFVVRQRDRCIAATVIQWLGSPCGFAWLSEVLAKCGYQLRRIETPALRRESDEDSNPPPA